MSDKKPILLTGVKPTGALHIGNYFGAVKPAVDLLNTGEYDSYIFVADYHALNFIQNAEEMRANSRDIVMTYIACGMDPEKVTLFRQSEVPAHTELAWIFDTITTMPYLMRAHAFKDAEAKGKEVSVGTFNYPMLMAADILLYDANLVPVGMDQKQHIEYARDTAEKFNRLFAKENKSAFTLPKEHIMPEVAVVPGTDGQKMSKSYGNTIPLFASREEIAKAVMGIVTDSLGSSTSKLAEVEVPAKNVYAIHKLVRPEDELAPIYEGNAGNYKALKEMLVEDLDAYLAPMRATYEELKKDEGRIDEILARGKERAREVSEAKMKRVRELIGVA